MRIWCYKTLTMEKPVAGSLSLSCLNFLVKCFPLKVFSKLFASNEKQIDNHTLMLDKLHPYMSVTYIYHSRGVFEKIFGVIVVLC